MSRYEDNEQDIYNYISTHDRHIPEVIPQRRRYDHFGTISSTLTATEQQR